MPTQLEIIADQQRQQHLAKNEYNYNDLYNSNNPNAVSYTHRRCRRRG